MKKITTLLIVTILTIASVFGLPGFIPSIPDTSGDFVYYRDNTFQREAYVGFLCYNDSTFCARFYAPANEAEELEEKSVAIYFTIDSQNDHMELTGEKIMGSFSASDGEYINYIHDMLYELNARRIKADPIPFEAFTKECSTKGQKDSFMDRLGFKVVDEFMQFGGQVTEIFNPLIPLFNLKKITGADGKDLFYVVAMGRITSSIDTTFTDFKGLDSIISEKSHNFSPNTKAATKIFSAGSQSLRVTDQWQSTLDILREGNTDLSQIPQSSQQIYEKIMNLNGVSTVFFSENPSVAPDQSYKGIPFEALRSYFFIPQAYTDLSTLKISSGKNSTTISFESKNPKDTNQSVSIHRFTHSDKIQYAIHFTAYADAYLNNKHYFDKILDSAKIK